MRNEILFLIVGFISFVSVVYCAPSDSNSVVVDGNHSNLESFGSDAETDDNEPVKYDGAQLWRIPFDNQDKRNAVAELQNNFGEIYVH